MEVSTPRVQNMMIQQIVPLKTNNMAPNTTAPLMINMEVEVPLVDDQWVPSDYNQPATVPNHPLHHHETMIPHSTIQKTATRYPKRNVIVIN